MVKSTEITVIFIYIFLFGSCKGKPAASILTASSVTGINQKSALSVGNIMPNEVSARTREVFVGQKPRIFSVSNYMTLI